MINYNKNKLINESLEQYYNTFSRTLDTADFVPEKFNKKIHKYIFKNMKKTFKKIDKEDRHFQKQVNLKQKKKLKKHKRNTIVILLIKLINNLKYKRLKRKHRLLTFTEKEKND